MGRTCSMQEIDDKYKAAGRKFRAATFCTAAPNIYVSSVRCLLHVIILVSSVCCLLHVIILVSSVRCLLHVIILVSGILRWLLGVLEKFFAPLACRVFIGRHDGKTPIVRSRCRWDDNIKIDVKEVGWLWVDYIRLARAIGTSKGLLWWR